MNKKFLTLLTSSALTMVLTGAVFSTEGREAEDKAHVKLGLETPEYILYEANLRFKFFMKENPQPEVERKISSRFTINESIPKTIWEKLSHDKVNGFGAVPPFLKELNSIDLTYLQAANPTLIGIDSSYINSYQQSGEPQQVERYFQKAIVGYTFTLSKEIKEESEQRLENLKAIASNAFFSERRRSFAQYSLIEQETKPLINTIKELINQEEFDKDSSIHKELLAKLSESYQEYKDMLNNKMSHTTRVSIKYHMAEINYLILRLVEDNIFGMTSKSFDEIKENFQTIIADTQAHEFTRGLAKRYLAEKPLS
jgi:hypothetical protein